MHGSVRQKSLRFKVSLDSSPSLNLFFNINALIKISQLLQLKSRVREAHLTLNNCSKMLAYFLGKSSLTKLISERYFGLGVEVEILKGILPLEVLLPSMVSDSLREACSCLGLASSRLIFSMCLLNIHYKSVLICYYHPMPMAREFEDGAQTPAARGGVKCPSSENVIIQQQMGNICCEEDNKTDRNRREIVPTHYRNVAQYERGRAQQEQQVEAQKELLRDFSIAVMKLRKSADDRPYRLFRGVYTHSSISVDEISQYFGATLMEENDDFKPCVVKKVQKERLTTQPLKRGVAIEYLVTSYHHSPFIVRNIHFYQDYTYLCLYFDLANYIHLNVFTHNPQFYAYFRSNLEQHIRFVVAGIILALEELHPLQVVYRGINNENIVIRENGYPMITNLANLHPEGHAVVAVLNSPFVSPEQFRNQPVNRSADFWALGVMIFHMITGNYPNISNYREGEFNPFGISPQLANLVNSLLQFDPQQRLGMRNITDLKAHAFFYGFDWSGYTNQQLQSPFASTRNDFPKRNPEEEQYDYHQKQNFDYSGYSYGGGAMMAGFLFLELGSLLMISTLFERQHLYDEQAFQNDQNTLAQMPTEQFQEGGAIQLSEGSNDQGDLGGDFD